MVGISKQYERTCFSPVDPNDQKLHLFDKYWIECNSLLKDHRSSVMDVTIAGKDLSAACLEVRETSNKIMQILTKAYYDVENKARLLALQSELFNFTSSDCSPESPAFTTTGYEELNDKRGKEDKVHDEEGERVDKSYKTRKAVGGGNVTKKRKTNV